MVHTSHPELLGLGFRAYLPARITACEIRVESFEGFKGLGEGLGLQGIHKD